MFARKSPVSIFTARYCAIVLFLLLCGFGLRGAQCYAQTPIYTVAGNGTAGFSGDGGAATGAAIYSPLAVALDSAGNIYFSGGQRIRMVSASTGKISTVAGNGTAGYQGDGGLAVDAELNQPFGIAVDSSGNIYIADRTNQRIRMVSASSGTISTVAGNGTAGYLGDLGAATNAELNYPVGVAVDSSGNIYIADSGNNRIRMVSAGAGIISTFAGDGTAGSIGDAGQAANAELNSPMGVFVDPSGNVFIADNGNNSVRKVSATTGIISTVAGNGTLAFSGDGGPATNAALVRPSAVAVDGSGNIYIADQGNQRIRVVSVGSGNISTYAGNGTAGFTGDGGPATNAEVNIPYGVACDPAGNVYIADANNSRVRVVATALPTTTKIESSNASVYLGANTTYTATVSPILTTAVPSGTVSFYADGTSIGTSSLSSGSASITNSTLAIGTHSIVASYANTAPFQASNSTAISQTTTKIPAGLTPTKGSWSFPYGSTGTITSLVAAADGSVPTGQCSGTINATTICTAVIVSGTCSCSVSNLAVGYYRLKLTYEGTDTYLSSYTNLGLTITPLTPTVSAWPTASPITFPQPMSASVLTGGTANVPGSFAWYSPNQIYAPNDKFAQAVFQPSDPTYSMVTHQIPIVVNTTTATVLSTSSTSVSYGTNDNLMATIWTRGVKPNGNVTFKAGDTTLGTVSPTAVSTLNELPLSENLYPGLWDANGGNTLTAAGGGADPFGGMSASVLSVPSSGTVTVRSYEVDTWDFQWNDGTFSLMLRTDAAPVNVSLNIFDWQSGAQWTSSCTAVSAKWTRCSLTTDSNWSGQGNIEIDCSGTGSAASLYVADLQFEQGDAAGPYVATGGGGATYGWGATATLATTSIPAGVQNIIAIYGNDTALPSSTSAPVTVTVAQANVTVSSWPSAAPIPYGSVLSASTLTGGSASVPGTFAWSTPTAVLGIGTSSQSVTFTPTDSADYQSVTSTVPVSVTKAPVSISVTSTKNPSIFQDSVTLTFTFSGAGAAIPSGTATLTDNGTALGTVTLDGAGKATYTTAAWAAGSHSITAVYNGDSSYF